MAVHLHTHDCKRTTWLTSRWVLADNLVLPRKMDQQPLFGFVREGQRYFSSREVLSVIEQYLTAK